ncbi:uncharacterized protein [Lepeophtheirus salmonis]|nr:filamin-B-like isoform X2 [Lepeophtheirus salmonis]
MANPNVEYLGVMSWAAQFQWIADRTPPGDRLEMKCSTLKTKVGEECNFKVDLLDEDIHPENLNAQVIGPSGPIYVNWDFIPGSGGTAYFQPSEVGMHKVLVTNEGEAVRGAPHFTRVMPSSKKDYDGIEPCAVESTVEVLINPHHAARPELLEVTAYSPTKRPLGCPVTEDNGTFYASFQPDEAGEWKIHVTYNNEDIENSPFKCMVFNPRAIHIPDQAAARTARPGDPFTFTVDASKTGWGEVGIDVAFENESIRRTFYVEEIAHRIYRVTFTPQARGKHKVYVYLHGMEVKGSPFSLKIGKDLKEKSKPSSELFRADKRVSRYKTFEEQRLEERKNYFTEKEIPIQAAPLAPPRVRRDKSKSVKDFKSEKKHQTTALFDSEHRTDDGMDLIPVKRKIEFDCPLLVDDDKNIKRGDISVEIRDPDDRKCYTNIRLNENRSFTCDFTTTKVGKHEIVVIICGNKLNCTPHFYTYDASKINIKDIPPGYVGSPVEFEIDGTGAGYGNLELVVNGGRVSSHVSKKSNSKYHASFIPHDMGRHRMDITFNGEKIPHSTWFVEVKDSNAKLTSPSLVTGKSTTTSTNNYNSSSVTNGVNHYATVNKQHHIEEPSSRLSSSDFNKLKVYDSTLSANSSKLYDSTLSAKSTKVYDSTLSTKSTKVYDTTHSVNSTKVYDSTNTAKAHDSALSAKSAKGPDHNLSTLSSYVPLRASLSPVRNSDSKSSTTRNESVSNHINNKSSTVSNTISTVTKSLTNKNYSINDINNLLDTTTTRETRTTPEIPSSTNTYKSNEIVNGHSNEYYKNILNKKENSLKTEKKEFGEYSSLMTPSLLTMTKSVPIKTEDIYSSTTKATSPHKSSYVTENHESHSNTNNTNNHNNNVSSVTKSMRTTQHQYSSSSVTENAKPSPTMYSTTISKMIKNKNIDSDGNVEISALLNSPKEVSLTLSKVNSTDGNIKSSATIKDMDSKKSKTATTNSTPLSRIPRKSTPPKIDVSSIIETKSSKTQSYSTSNYSYSTTRNGEKTYTTTTSSSSLTKDDKNPEKAQQSTTTSNQSPRLNSYRGMAEKCSFDDEVIKNFKAGKPASFILKAPGHKKDEVEVNIISPERRPNIPCKIVDEGNGVFRIEFTTVEVGTYAVDVTVSGLTVPQSPFLAKAYDSSLIKVTDITDGVKGSLSTFWVDASKAGDGQLEISINDGEVSNSVQLLEGGKCLVTFTPTQSITHEIEVTFNDEQVPGSPFLSRITDVNELLNYEVNDSGFSRVSVTLDHLSMVPIGDPSQFTIHVADGDDAELAVSVQGPSDDIPVKVTGSVKNGFTAEFVPQEVGIHLILVEYNEIAVGGTPFYSKAYDVSSVDVSEIPKTNPGKTVTFAVDASEAGDGNLEIFVQSRKNFRDNYEAGYSLKTHVEPLGDAHFNVSFLPEELEDHIVCITFNDHNVPGSPFVSKLSDNSRNNNPSNSNYHRRIPKH